MSTKPPVETRFILWFSAIFSLCIAIIATYLLEILHAKNRDSRVAGSKLSTHFANSNIFCRLLDLAIACKNLTHFSTYLRPISSLINDKASTNPGKFFRDLWKMMNIEEKQKIALKFVMLNHCWQIKAIGKHIKELQSFTAPLIAQQKINTLLIDRKIFDNRYNEFVSGKITTILTFHPDHLNDVEVIEALYLWINKIGKEHCLIRCSAELIVHDFKTIPSAITLVSVGHGYLRATNKICYCGPYKGFHDEVVTLLTKMIQQCNQLSKVVLSHCYYGSPIVSPTLSSQLAFSSKHLPSSGRQKATFFWQKDRPKVIPFKKTSFAGMLWMNLYKCGRLNQDFALVASPQFLNPFPFEHPRCFIGSDQDQYKPSTLHPTKFWTNQSEKPQLENLKTIKLLVPRV